MKLFKSLLIAVLAFVATDVAAQAPQGPQRPQGQHAQRGQRPPRQRMTIEQRAEMQADRMAKNLDLNQEQKKQIYDYHLATYKQQQEEQQARMKAFREGQQGQQGQRPDFRNMSDEQRAEFMQKMQEARQKQQAEYEAAMKGILTKKQFKKWQMQRRAQEQRMRQRMMGGEGAPQQGFGGENAQGGGERGFGGEGGFGGGF